MKKKLQTRTSVVCLTHLRSFLKKSRRLTEKCIENFVHLPISEILEVVHGPLMEYRGQKRLLGGVQQIGQAIRVEINNRDVVPV